MSKYRGVTVYWYVPNTGFNPWCAEPGTWSHRNLWTGALMLELGGSWWLLRMVGRRLELQLVQDEVRRHAPRRPALHRESCQVFRGALVQSNASSVFESPMCARTDSLPLVFATLAMGCLLRIHMLAGVREAVK